MLCQSDDMLCTNKEYLLYKDFKENNQLFLQHMNRTFPCGFIDREKESQMWTDTYKTRVASCIENTLTRGGNATTNLAESYCPKKYDAFELQEFMMVPCRKPTHKNYIAEGNDRYCSKRHQIFGNQTKRKDIT